MITGQFSHIYLTLIYTLIPLVIIFIIDWKHKFLEHNIRVILMMTIIAIIYGLFTEVFATTYWKIWAFDANQITNFWIFGSPVDDLIFIALIAVVLSAAVLEFIHDAPKCKKAKRR